MESFENPASGSDPASAPEGKWAQAVVLRLARSMGVNRAVAFAVMARFWQLFTGPVTQMLIVLRFSSATQDYYYAFNTMLGMQVFVELGLHVVLINLASREWAHLSLEDGQIVGDSRSLLRLVTLGRMAFRWYLTVAIVFVIALTIAGSAYFSIIDLRRIAKLPDAEIIRWMMPWAFMVLLNGLQLSLLPLTAILEGCHQLGPINRNRFWQAVAGSLVVWTTMAAGFGLWALVAAATVRTVGESILVFVRFRGFFKPGVRAQVTSDDLNWRTEVLPLQWRMAIQGVVAWGANQMPILAILYFHPNSFEAGRLGMTWTILNALQSACAALVDTRRPLFGSLIARGEFRELDQQFFRFTKLAIVFMTVAVSLFSTFVWLVGIRSEWLAVRISEHLLPVDSTILLSLAFLAYLFVMSIGIYVRAHRVEPFLWASVVSCLVLAVMEFWLGREYGAFGVAIAYVGGVVLLLLPSYTWIWWTFRKHRSAGELESASGTTSLPH